MPLTLPKVDLTTCDREPIHVLGAVQPFGVLIALSADWLISRISANVGTHLGIDPASALGQPLSNFLTSEAIHAIRNRLTLLRGPDAVERLFGLPLVEGRPPFDVAIHFGGDTMIIEAEPSLEAEGFEAATLVRGLVNRLSQTDSLPSFFREGARQVRALTGFDRVMVYRFDGDGSGEVVAESLRPGVDSFLGLHYPASDIPRQARTLYLRNTFRIIADVTAPAVPILPEPEGNEAPLDLSLSVTRAVSPIHIEYLTNMGVRASLSISIIVGGKLWGLFACHHYQPRLPSFARRTAAELFGQMYSLMLESRERHETTEYENRARSVADRLMAAVAQDDTLLSRTEWLGEMVNDAIPADGVGVFIDGAVALTGLTPGRVEFTRLIQRLNRTGSGAVFTTDHLASMLPEAEAYQDRAAGMMAIPMSRAPRDYVVLFRQERLRSVRWAGNPEKPANFGPLGERLTPRKSFEEWSALVKGRAEPFKAAEQRVGEVLRNALIEIVLRMSESAHTERDKAHERQELLIAELNHRVRNILALIRGIVNQSRIGADTLEGFTSTLDGRIQALARAHDQLTAQHWSPGDLRQLVETEAGAYLASKSNRLITKGPDILLEPSAFSTLALVMHELVTNAAKYGALSDNGSVTVAWRTDDDGSLLIDWRERGGPGVTAPAHRGFGSTIIERSIPFDLKGHAEVHYRVTGLEATFCIPSRYVVQSSGPQARRGAHRWEPDTSEVAERPLSGRVLLVEDSMIIALDGEDVLKALGAEDVVVAPSLRQALAAVDQTPPSFALLDVNLGTETSLPVADLLAERGIPFIFASGYGDQFDPGPGHRDVPVAHKPYRAESLASLIARVSRG